MFGVLFWRYRIGGAFPGVLAPPHSFSPQRRPARRLLPSYLVCHGCLPCVIEMPGFQRVYDDYKDRGFPVLGVSRDQGAIAHEEAFLQQKGITYPVAMARDVDLGASPTSQLFLLLTS